MTKSGRKFAIIFGVVFSIFNAVLAAQNAQTIRVGFFSFSGYHQQDEKGNKSGYGYELLQRMAGYGGFRYEYIGFDKSWSEMQEMLASGEIDLLTSAQKTPARLKRFDFSDKNVGVSSAILTVKAGKTASPFLIGDYKNWNGIKVGMIKNNSRNDDFFELAKEQNFTYQVIYFDNVNKMVEELKTGDSIDAILTSTLRSIKNEIIIVQFAPSPFYVMVKKGNTELLKKINQAIFFMDNYEAGFRTKLMNKYYSIDTTSEIAFDATERKYIENMKDKTFNVIINPDREPYSYYKDGILQGSFIEIAKRIMERSELNFNFVQPENRLDYWEKIKNHEVDIRIDAGENFALAEQYGYWLTPTYMEVPVARLKLKDTVAFNTVGFLTNSDIASKYVDIFKKQNLEIVMFDSTEELAKNVSNGNISMAVLPLASAYVAVRNDIKNSMTTEVLYGYSTSYSVAINNEASPILYSIIEKTVSSLTEQEINKYSQEFSDNLKRDFSIIGFMYDNPFAFIMCMVVILIVIIIIFLSSYFYKRRAIALAQVAKEQKLNEVLQDAVKRTELADKAKSSFMSRMSHEIRTPLNAVIGYNIIARNEMTQARTEVEHRQAEMKTIDCLTKSEIASKHLLTIINDVLDMSAIESGKIKIAHEKFDFKGLISALTTVFYTQAKSKGVELEVVFETLTEEWFIGDQMRVNQILTNLISNAVKFTHDGGKVQLSICQPDAKENAAHIRFEVADTGIGMQADYIEHIWTPFEQADSSISRRFGGSGLGLSITKNLVDLMGGTITVESEVGKGSKFIVDLTFERTEQPSNSDTYDFSKINALVVDDDSSTCDYIKLLFNRFGARCTSVTSGQEAIDIFTQAQGSTEPFTVCLVDWRMPKMDGIETIKHIREISGAEIPIIVITAYDYTEIADKAAKVGVNSFISKPLFQSSLFNLLANMCGKPALSKGKQQKKYKFSGEHILLAEDNVMNMEIAISILESAGLDVRTAMNGKEAVDLFEKSEVGTFDAILMDVQMPVMDGHEATKVIRASSHPEAKSIPIIAMTADAFAENVAEALSAGMNDHISKPIDLPTLFETLQKYI